MTTDKRFVLIERKGVDYVLDSPNYELDFIEMLGDSLSSKEIVDLLNKEEETIQKQNQEITACYDTLTTIIELCTAVLDYEFKNVNNKADFCHMLNEMDNKDLAFLKECFEAIRNRDLKKTTSLIMEIKRAKEYKNGDVE